MSVVHTVVRRDSFDGVDISIPGEDNDLVAVSAQGGFLGALAEPMNPQWFAGGGVEAVEERRVSIT